MNNVTEPRSSRGILTTQDPLLTLITFITFVLSVVALILSYYTWWVSVQAPPTIEVYAASRIFLVPDVNNANREQVLIPLTLVNTGANSGVVRDIRLAISLAEGDRTRDYSPAYLTLEGAPVSDGMSDGAWFVPIAVPGRSHRTVTVGFQVARDDSKAIFDGRSDAYVAKLQFSAPVAQEFSNVVLDLTCPHDGSQCNYLGRAMRLEATTRGAAHQPQSTDN